ncbi:glycosyl transferase group 1 [Solidesulfovibrio carbinoliphilus subsp. oakridgensis]|uniref:Glycosyl transferase group 1 n=1 Tax=Solidesulfovibrio carbinoliphilus subsp. oakridgensis TaxID=694327 RepID=G7Q6U3_9BACT|nr:glycosyltransferase family 4 protein [Solidesulfovibrio carbinoliphilus]EHJ48028.1 glycosyl transferase group 1 [Solidesulfovibrio carbinoliphilus subsp. oakridgensis]
MSLPKTAYILLWYPLPSETFIFREVENAKAAGMPFSVYALYGAVDRNLSAQMRHVAPTVSRLGLAKVPAILADMAWWAVRRPVVTARLLATIPWRRWSCLEVAGENLWAMCAGFSLARRFLERGIQHIHAGWANGPATAAWVASTLSGIPFSFSARAGDIYPADGALAEKMRAAAAIHTNNKANIGYLSGLVPEAAGKIRQIYNSLTLSGKTESPVHMEPPYRLLAVGRFCRTKGFDVLLDACALLSRRGFPFQLTLVGAGMPWPTAVIRRRLRVHGLRARVFLPGFVSHDRMGELYAASDIFVMPSVIHASGDRDGIPNVIMEALAHRLPVVATAVSGIPEVVEDGVTGRLVPQRNPEALADAIMDLAADRGRALALAAAGRDRVAAMFDPETNTRAILDFFAAMPGRRQG